MILLIVFAFVAGIVTILSPCILPILPIVLSGSVTGGKRKPFGVITGFIISFTFFTLFLSTLVKIFNIPPDSLRLISVFIITVFGITLIYPKWQQISEFIFSRLANKINPSRQINDGFAGGILIGLSLGLLWTPCVGPILASIITLAIAGTVTSTTFFITLAYSTGTAIPMLAITYGGRALLQKHPFLLQNSARIQKVFGAVMIVTALAIFFNFDRKFQTFILEKFPQYGANLTKFEDNPLINQTLKNLNPTTTGFSSPNAPELVPSGEWFNSQPLALKELKGKVVLIDFWTYTCINCIRTLPYLKSWYAKYKDMGFVIIGVHTPEFEFEKNPDNVQKAIKDFGILYPVMQDNDYATWNAYQNRYWPAKYFIDINGKIRKTHFGEGDYDESERFIQELLKEKEEFANIPISNPNYKVTTQTPEMYLGLQRLAYLYPEKLIAENKELVFEFPDSIPFNKFSYVGNWSISSEYANPKQNSQLVLHFSAKEVFLVMRPRGNIIGKIKVYLDEKLVNEEVKGDDVTIDAIVTVDSDRLYKLIKLPKPGEHLLKLEFQDDNLELYAFTFG